jgi:ribosome-associated protein
MKIKKINQLKKEIEIILNDNKAMEIKSINLKDKSSIADFMIIASGTSSRHIQSLSEILIDNLKKKGISNCRLEGKNSNDWKLIDAIDIIVHIFHPEKRKFYDLEKMWSELIPKEKLII